MDRYKSFIILIYPAKFLLDSFLWFAGSFIAYTMFVSKFLSISWNYNVGLLVLFSILYAYNFDHLVDLKFQKNITEKTKKLNEGGLILFSLASLTVSALCLFYLFLNFSNLTRAIDGICIIIGVLYAVPTLPVIRTSNSQFELIRLKDIPYFKAICVAAVTTFGLIGLPLSYSHSHIDVNMVAIIAASTFILMFIGTNICDIPDMDADKDSGIKTIPVLFGVDKTKNFLLVLSFISILSLFFLPLSGLCSFSTILPIVVTFVATIGNIFIAGSNIATAFPYFYDLNCTLFYLPLLLSFIFIK